MKYDVSVIPLSISINENQIVQILINYESNLDDITNYLRNIIKVSKNAKLVIIEDGFIIYFLFPNIVGHEN